MKETNVVEDKKRLEKYQNQQRLVEMYSKHPWPSYRNADEEMGWRLKSLGINPADYKGKKGLDLGCGTGEYSLWYASNGSSEVIGVDLSEGSLEKAKAIAETQRIKNVFFQKKDILELDFPDNSFDFVYSVGVLHHTADPYKGFEHMSRVAKPGGIVIISLYSKYGCWKLRIQRKICERLGGDDVEKRARVGKRLFPLTLKALNKRYHGHNPDKVIYDTFAVPLATYHSAQEILRWFDKNNIEYVGAFPPLQLKDYFYTFSQPEYKQFRSTFAGFPFVRLAANIMGKLSSIMYRKKHSKNHHRPFKRPSYLSMIFCQMIWLFFGTRFYCFTLAGRKRKYR